MRELELEKWGRGRWKPLVVFAHWAAIGADAMYRCCGAAHNPKCRDFFARVEDKAAWLKNYREQVLFMADPNFIKEIVAMFFNKKDSNDLLKLYRGIHWFASASGSDVKAKVRREIRETKLTSEKLGELVNEINKAIDDFYKAHLLDLRQEAKGIQAQDDELWLSLVTTSPRARFFFLVVIPCWIEFGKSPTELFQRAQSGDFEALCMLVNVDHLCLGDPKISKAFHKHMESNEVKRDKLTRAMKYKPLKKLKRKAIKVLLAALVYKVFNQMHESSMKLQKKFWKKEMNKVRVLRHEITFAAVKKLFDAAYKDFHEKLIPDPDFSGITPDGFALSVKRSLPFWSGI